MPVGSVTPALPPQVSTALAALSSSLNSEAAVATALLGGGTGGGSAGAVNPGLGQVVDLSA
jgi:hypothetical protein